MNLKTARELFAKKSEAQGLTRIDLDVDINSPSCHVPQRGCKKISPRMLSGLLNLAEKPKDSMTIPFLHGWFSEETFMEWFGLKKKVAPCLSQLIKEQCDIGLAKKPCMCKKRRDFKISHLFGFSRPSVSFPGLSACVWLVNELYTDFMPELRKWVSNHDLKVQRLYCDCGPISTFEARRGHDMIVVWNPKHWD